MERLTRLLDKSKGDSEPMVNPASLLDTLPSSWSWETLPSVGPGLTPSKILSLTASRLGKGYGVWVRGEGDQEWVYKVRRARMNL